MIYDVAVVGCGASGMACAITAARRGLTVLVLEKNTGAGRKLRATGNGRCNLANAHYDDTCYRGNGQAFIRGIVNEGSTGRVLDFFRGLGLSVTEKNGYYYPASMQASAVVQVLERAMEHAGVVACYGRQVTEISYQEGKYRIQSEISKELCREQARAGKKGKKVHTNEPVEKDTGFGKGNQITYEARNLVIATGGYAGSQYGCCGDGYTFAGTFGHHGTAIHPGLVPLISDETFCGQLSGVRAAGEVAIYVDETKLYASQGEIQFTEYGISGICVFDVSRFAVRALSMGKKVRLSLDFLPEWIGTDVMADYRERECAPLFCELLSRTDYLSVKEVLCGMLPEKLAGIILARAGISPVLKACSLDVADQAKLLQQIKDFQMNITGSKDYDMAQVTAGGMDTGEVTAQFASKLQQGLYLVGELLDVDGACGGYNLTFAFLSGIICGETVG